MFGTKADGKIPINLLDSYGRVTTLRFHQWSTIRDVQQAIQQQMGIKIGQQSLYLGSQELRSKSMLIDLDICENSKIYLRLHNEADDNAIDDSIKIFGGVPCPNEFMDIIIRSREGLSIGLTPKLAPEGTAGTYFLRDRHRNNVAVFKPQCQEPFMPDNPRGYVGTGEGRQSMFRNGIFAGEGNVREAAAYLLDHEHLASVPYTTRVEIASVHFEKSNRSTGKYIPPFARSLNIEQLLGPGSSVSSKSSKNGSQDNKSTKSFGKNKKNVKIGSLQEYVIYDDLAGDLAAHTFPVREVLKIALLDIRLVNSDRNDANILVKRGAGPYFPSSSSMSTPFQSSLNMGVAASPSPFRFQSQSTPRSDSLTVQPSPAFLHSNAGALQAVDRLTNFSLDDGISSSSSTTSTSTTTTTTTTTPSSFSHIPPSAPMCSPASGTNDSPNNQPLELLAAINSTSTKPPVLARSRSNDSIIVGLSSINANTQGQINKTSSIPQSKQQRQLDPSKTMTSARALSDTFSQLNLNTVASQSSGTSLSTFNFVKTSRPYKASSTPRPSPALKPMNTVHNPLSFPSPSFLSLAPQAPSPFSLSVPSTTVEEEEDEEVNEEEILRSKTHSCSFRSNDQLTIATGIANKISQANSMIESPRTIAEADIITLPSPSPSTGSAYPSTTGDLSSLSPGFGSISGLQSVHADRKRFNANVKLIPIDHAYCLPDTLEIGWGDWVWLGWPQCKEPLDLELKEYVAKIDIDADEQLLRGHYAIREPCLRLMRINCMLLKKGVAAGLTIYDIATIICRDDMDSPSELEVLCAQAQELAKQHEPLRRVSHSRRSSTCNPSRGATDASSATFLKGPLHTKRASTAETPPFHLPSSLSHFTNQAKTSGRFGLSEHSEISSDDIDSFLSFPDPFAARSSHDNSHQLSGATTTRDRTNDNENYKKRPKMRRSLSMAALSTFNVSSEGFGGEQIDKPVCKRRRSKIQMAKKRKHAIARQDSALHKEQQLRFFTALNKLLDIAVEQRLRKKGYARDITISSPDSGGRSSPDIEALLNSQRSTFNAPRRASSPNINISPSSSSSSHAHLRRPITLNTNFGLGLVPFAGPCLPSPGSKSSDSEYADSTIIESKSYHQEDQAAGLQMPKFQQKSGYAKRQRYRKSYAPAEPKKPSSRATVCNLSPILKQHPCPWETTDIKAQTGDDDDDDNIDNDSDDNDTTTSLTATNASQSSPLSPRHHHPPPPCLTLNSHDSSAIKQLPKAAASLDSPESVIFSEPSSPELPGSNFSGSDISLSPNSHQPSTLAFTDTIGRLQPECETEGYSHDNDDNEDDEDDDDLFSLSSLANSTNSTTHSRCNSRSQSRAPSQTRSVYAASPPASTSTSIAAFQDQVPIPDTKVN